VYDIDAGRPLFSLRATVGRPPASVEKLYTSVAVLTRLGPGMRLRTSVLGAGHLGRGGVWHGSLYLRGAGDPTFGDGTFNAIWEQGYGPTAEQLVHQLLARGIRRVTGSVIGDASLFDARRGGPATGFAADIPDIGGQLAALTYDHGAATRRLSPGAFAAKELALTMRGSHIRARAVKFTAVTPPGAQRLASVSSPPMSILLRLTDVPSDDFFAEMLTKQLGVRFGTGGSTEAGAQVIASMVGAFGVHPKIADGSGLSRANRSSPLEVVDLLRSVWNTPTGGQLEASLPTVGVNGTVRRIGAGTVAQRRCVAKTGTLNFVTNLAGYCHSRGGHMLAFALFLDGPSNTQAVVLLSRMVAAIARY
jgi:D-alanyl-D-alanine carboxypeptidase/D-alanyl-D-alanine-endopeptidase (penicillin-binding protein 4)